MIRYLVFYIGLLSLSGVVGMNLKSSLYKGMLFSILSITILLYLTGMFFGFSFTSFLVSILMFVSFCYLVIEGYKKKLESFIFLHRKEFIIYGVLFIFGAYLFYNKMFTSWDEFSHWGLVDKSIFMFKDFPHKYETNQLAFRGYPVMLSIWQTSSTLLLNTYSEYYLMFTNYILYVTAFLVIIDLRILKAKISSTLLYLLLILVSMIVFNSTFIIHIYVDVMLGVLSALALILYLNQKKSKINALLLLLVSVFLPLVKETGYFLLLMIFVTLLIFELIERDKANVRIIILVILFATLAKYSWNFIKVTEAWKTSGLNATNIKLLLLKQAEQYKYETVKEFATASFSRFITKGQLKFTLLSALGTVTLLLYFLKVKIKVLVTVIVTMTLFIISLLILYVFTFSAYEAVRLASFERYLATVFSFSILIIIYYAIDKMDTKKTLFTLLVLSFFIDQQSLAPYIAAPIVNRDSVKLRSKYDIEEDTKELLAGKNVLVLSLGDKGFDYWVLKNELIESIVTGWSYGKPYFEGDIWTKKVSETEFLAIIEQVDYVYFFKYDKKFLSDFPSFSALQTLNNSNKLFQVNKECSKDASGCEINKLLIPVK